MADAADLPALRHVVAEQMRYYNAQRRHATLEYMAPPAYLDKARHERQA